MLLFAVASLLYQCVFSNYRALALPSHTLSLSKQEPFSLRYFKQKYRRSDLAHLLAPMVTALRSMYSGQYTRIEDDKRLSAFAIAHAFSASPKLQLHFADSFPSDFSVLSFFLFFSLFF